MIRIQFVLALPVVLVLAGAGHAQQNQQGQRPPPPPPMMKGFALEGTSATGSANIHLFMLGLMPPGRGGPQMLGVDGQSQQGVSATDSSGASNGPRGHAMIAGQPYRLVNVSFNGDTSGSGGALTPGQPPTSLTAYLATAQAPGTNSGTTGTESTVGQLALTFQQIEGQTVITGTAQTSTGAYSILASMERPGGPGGPRGAGGNAQGFPGNAPGGQYGSWQGPPQGPWQGGAQGQWQGTSQSSWGNAFPAGYTGK